MLLGEKALPRTATKAPGPIHASVADAVAAMPPEMRPVVFSDVSRMYLDQMLTDSTHMPLIAHLRHQRPLVPKDFWLRAVDYVDRFTVRDEQLHTHEHWQR